MDIFSSLFGLAMHAAERLDFLFLLINYRRNEIVRAERLKKLKTRGVNLLVHNFFLLSFLSVPLHLLCHAY